MGKKLTALMILDGFGECSETRGNAICIAGVPNISRLREEYPTTRLKASGRAVGLPEGQMGNSEVGHLNIGAGRIVYQELTRITKDIEDGGFFEKTELIRAMDNAKNNGTKLHAFGLVSDGGVHSHIEHLFALLRMAKDRGLSQVYVHCFMDGRDVPPDSGKTRSSRSSAAAVSRASWGATTPWTATTATSASRRRTPRWSAARAKPLFPARRPCRVATIAATPTSSCCPP